MEYCIASNVRALKWVGDNHGELEEFLPDFDHYIVGRDGTITGRASECGDGIVRHEVDGDFVFIFDGCYSHHLYPDHWLIMNALDGDLSVMTDREFNDALRAAKKTA